MTDTAPLAFVIDVTPPEPFALDAPAVPGPLPVTTSGPATTSCEGRPTYATASPTLA